MSQNINFSEQIFNKLWLVKLKPDIDGCDKTACIILRAPDRLMANVLATDIIKDVLPEHYTVEELVISGETGVIYQLDNKCWELK